MEPFDERLQKLLTASVRVFADQGFQGTSMRALARASGMSLAGMYHYVSSKTELLFLIQDRCFAQVITGAREAVAGASDPVERLRGFIRHHVEFFTAHMAEMKVLSHEEDELDGTMRAQIRRRKREYVDLLLELLGEVPGVDVDRELAAYALFGMMNWIYTWYHPGGRLSPERLADGMAQLFLAGFLQPTTQTAAALAVSHGG